MKHNLSYASFCYCFGYTVTVTTGTVRYSNYSGQYVVTQDYGLNNIKYNLRFDRDIVEGDKIRIVGKIFDVEDLVGTNPHPVPIKSFDMQGTIPSYDKVLGDRQPLVCSDNNNNIRTWLYIGDGSFEDLYGDVSSPCMGIDSETPLVGYGFNTYLSPYDLEIYVNDVKCNKRY